MCVGGRGGGGSHASLHVLNSIIDVFDHENP